MIILGLVIAVVLVAGGFALGSWVQDTKGWPWK